MTRRFQFSLRGLLGQMTLAAIGLAFLGGVTATSGIMSLCLYELAAGSFGAIIGLVVSVRIGRPCLCAAAFAGVAMPLAIVALPMIWFAAELMARMVR